MPQLLASILDQVRLPTTILDIGITALLIYWLFSLIRGTSAVRLVIGVTVLFAVYFAARVLSLRLLTQILETGAVVGLFALVVVFQPELRRALDRIGRVGSLGWLMSADDRIAENVATQVARAAAGLSREGHGALMVIERETGLEQLAESGVMIRGDLTADLLRTIFWPKSPLHDGAVIIRNGRILAAGAVLPLAETTINAERYGTRHRAALGTTEQTDAIVVVVSEENGHVSLVQKARIVRNLNEHQLTRALRGLLEPGSGQAGRTGRFPDLGRAVRNGRRPPPPPADPLPPAESMRPDAAAPQPAAGAGDPPPVADPPAADPPATVADAPGDPVEAAAKVEGTPAAGARRRTGETGGTRRRGR